MADFVKIGNITINIDQVAYVHRLRTMIDIHFTGKDAVTLQGRDAQVFESFLDRQVRNLAEMQKIEDRRAADRAEWAAKMYAKHGEAPF